MKYLADPSVIISIVLFSYRTFLAAESAVACCESFLAGLFTWLLPTVIAVCGYTCSLL